MIRGLTGGILLLLPEDPVSPGISWSTDVTYPLSPLRGVGREEGVPADGELHSHAEALLDSVVTRGADNLYYLTISGSFEPSEFASTLGNQATAVTVTGSFASMMIWSSAKSAFVSSATNAVVGMEVRDPGSAASVSEVRFEVITYTQSRT
jgi:hypothetical protein